MAMEFALNSLGPVPGAAAAKRVPRTPQPELHEALAPPSLYVCEAAVEAGGLQLFIPIVQPRIGPSHYQLVGALVTFAIMAWFVAGLALITVVT